METIEDADTLTILVDGDVHATAHREFDRRVYTIAAIDADGDPQNGLTPEWVLPRATDVDDAYNVNFERALEHIVTQTGEDH